MNKYPYLDINFSFIAKNQFYDSNGQRIDNTTLLSDNIDILVRNNDDPACIIKDQVLIFFGAYNDNFGAIYNILKFYPGPIVYLIDKTNTWYENKLNTYKSFINDFEKLLIRTNNYIFMGFSMGGYPAIYLSILFPEKKCVCITITPQIMNFYNFSNKILLKDLQNGTTEKEPLVTSIMNIKINLQDHLKANINTKIFIIIGKSECTDYETYKMHMYLDLFHAGILSTYDNIGTIILNRSTHVLGVEIDLPYIYNCILNNFDIIYNDYKIGILKIGRVSYMASIKNKRINDLSIIYGNIDDNKGHIRPALQNLILFYDTNQTVDIIASRLICQNTPNNQSEILCPLIWKTLFICGYDIPEELFSLDNFCEDNTASFNNSCEELSKIRGWDKYAIYCLIYDQTIDLPVITDDIIIPRISKRYCAVSQYFNFSYLKKNNGSGGNNKYEKKYMKYKIKYLNNK